VASRPLPAASLVLRRKVLDRDAQADAHGAAQVLDLRAQADARNAAQILDRGTQALARG
jgi:hypothetical protein